MSNIFILDTETASLSGGVVEFAGIRISESVEVLESFCHRVNPERPIEPGAQAIHGISDEDVANCPTLKEVSKDLPNPLWMVAHNAPFDERMLQRSINIERRLCTLSLARQYLKDAPRHKLETLVEFYNLGGGTAHSALGDVESTLELLRLLIKVSNCTLLQLFDQYASDRLVHYMPFGKYKGYHILDVPKSYREWLRGQELPKELSFTLNKFKDM